MTQKTLATVTLTDENYYQDTTYMSTSRMKAYMECEAKQLAIDHGNWDDKPKNTKALLVGNFIHSYFEGKEAHEAFIADNEDKLIAKSGKNKGGLLSDFQVANKVIKVLEADKYFMEIYHGTDKPTQKETIVTGELAGMDFKGKIDSLNLEAGYFIDLKTMASLTDEKYSPKLKQYVPQVLYNIFEFDYHMQMYVYSELLGQQFNDFFTPYIVAVDKQENANKQLIRVDSKLLKKGEDRFNGYIQRLKLVTGGLIEPKHCGKCDYCRAHNQLTHSVTVDEILAEAAG